NWNIYCAPGGGTKKSRYIGTALMAGYSVHLVPPMYGFSCCQGHKERVQGSKFQIYLNETVDASHLFIPLPTISWLNRRADEQAFQIAMGFRRIVPGRRRTADPVRQRID